MSAHLPSLVQARGCMAGDPAACVGAVGMTLERALAMGMGLALAGHTDHLLRDALAASLAVEVFVFVWGATQPPHEDLPSHTAVIEGNIPGIAATWFARSLIASVGVYALGEREHPLRKGMAATAAVEVVILAWAARNRRRARREALQAAQEGVE